MKIDIKDTGVVKNLNLIKGKTGIATRVALEKALDTLLLLSSKEVPLDEGTLLKSGHRKVESNTSGYVAYNTEYAAFQHEGGDGARRIKSYQNDRKGKYLEDPLFRNKDKFIEKINESVKQSLGFR